MNTIMITGSAKTIGKPSINGVAFSVEYDVNIWGAKEGEQIQFITSLSKLEVNGYRDVWQIAKNKAETYFNDSHLSDGAYTQFLDHLVTV